MAEHEINWNDCDVWQKRGWCVVRETIEVQAPEAQVPAGVKLGPVMRPVVQPDWNIPIFSKERDYIDQYVDVDNFPGNQKERLNREGVE